MKKIEITISDELTLDAGSIEESIEQFVVHPPSTPMIDQIIAYLDEKPERFHDLQIRHQSVAFTALCVRWGSYFATLIDENTELHPAIPGLHKEQPTEYSFISDSEMKRLNIEISFNLWRMVQIFRERDIVGLWHLLNKARDFIPMPHKQIPRDREAMNEILMALATGAFVIEQFERGEGSPMFQLGANGNTQPMIRRIEPENADRFLSNMLTCQAWRNTIIEDLHAGKTPPELLKPHQIRFTKRTQLAIFREVTANMGNAFAMMDPLFDPDYEYKALPLWPHTATALANSFYGLSVSSWSLTDVSSPVMLRKEVQEARAS
jgi:hypothetical protein